jgi:hypothetical protein
MSPTADRARVGDRRKAVLISLAAAPCHRGYAGRAAELAQEAVDARSIGTQLGCQGRESERAEGSEQESNPDALDGARSGQPDCAPVVRHLRHQLERARRNRHPGNEQDPVVDLVDQISDCEHRRHRPDAARRNDQTRPGRIVPQRAFTQ